MPAKQSLYKSYGEKLISLFAHLLFSGESYSLSELSRMLKCSKQTVLRLVADIKKAHGISLEEATKGNKKYYNVVRPRNLPVTAALSEMELTILQMCRDFTAHLLGPKLFEEATQALLKSKALLPEGGHGSFQNFASFRPGSIDFTPHQDTFRKIIEATDARSVCRVTYQSSGETKPKSYYIKPLKIFSHRDTIYLHARMAKAPGKKYREPDFDPLLAIHRLKNVEITETSFDFPADYNFEKAFNRDFGIMKEESFKVIAEFSGWAATYVSERIWSTDQKVVKKTNGAIRLTFTASSEYEVISWLLSFGEESKLIKPKWLTEEINKKLYKMQAYYSKYNT